VNGAEPGSEPVSDEFWSANQPGFRFSDADVGSPEFFADVERHRYELEPHISDVVGFGRWAGRDVLEAGCGIATDGLQFARAGARYTGLDRGSATLELARKRFALEGQSGTFVRGSITELPFDDAAFDLVYSHGVIHHIDATQRAADEFFRVLRPGGTVLVMVYHRASINYHVTIMGLRRLLAPVLLAPGGVGLVARATGESTALLEGHRMLLREHGRRYLTDRQLFLSHNTDGPGNPLSKAYTADELRRIFSRFVDVGTTVRHLNLRSYPGGGRLVRSRFGRRLERSAGWHLYLEGRKPS
jgi:SAM-dependent methyltransferase